MDCKACGTRLFVMSAINACNLFLTFHVDCGLWSKTMTCRLPVGNVSIDYAPINHQGADSVTRVATDSVAKFKPHCLTLSCIVLHTLRNEQRRSTSQVLQHG